MYEFCVSQLFTHFKNNNNKASYLQKPLEIRWYYHSKWNIKRNKSTYSTIRCRRLYSLTSVIFRRDLCLPQHQKGICPIVFTITSQITSSLNQVHFSLFKHTAEGKLLKPLFILHCIITRCTRTWTSTATNERVLPTSCTAALNLEGVEAGFESSLTQKFAWHFSPRREFGENGRGIVRYCFAHNGVESIVHHVTQIRWVKSGKDWCTDFMTSYYIAKKYGAHSLDFSLKRKI